MEVETVVVGDEVYEKTTIKHNPITWILLKKNRVLLIVIILVIAILFLVTAGMIIVAAYLLVRRLATEVVLKRAVSRRDPTKFELFGGLDPYRMFSSGELGEIHAGLETLVAKETGMFNKENETVACKLFVRFSSFLDPEFVENIMCIFMTDYDETSVEKKNAELFMNIVELFKSKTFLGSAELSPYAEGAGSREMHDKLLDAKILLENVGFIKRGIQKTNRRARKTLSVVRELGETITKTKAEAKTEAPIKLKKEVTNAVNKVTKTSSFKFLADRTYHRMGKNIGKSINLLIKTTIAVIDYLINAFYNIPKLILDSETTIFKKLINLSLYVSLFPISSIALQIVELKIQSEGLDTETTGENMLSTGPESSVVPYIRITGFRDLISSIKELLPDYDLFDDEANDIEMMIRQRSKYKKPEDPMDLDHLKPILGIKASPFSALGMLRLAMYKKEERERL